MNQVLSVLGAVVPLVILAVLIALAVRGRTRSGRRWSDQSLDPAVVDATPSQHVSTSGQGAHPPHHHHHHHQPGVSHGHHGGGFSGGHHGG